MVNGSSRPNFVLGLECALVMHLSMLSRRGGRPGIGGAFDVISLPVVGTFDHSSSPRGLYIPILILV